MKKWTASSEQLKPDPKYNNKLVSKFINALMWDGKKNTAQRIFYDAMDIIEKKLKTQNSKLKVVQVISADEMFKAVRKYFSRCDCLIMAAAVADYTPARKSKVKIKKSKGELIIKLKPTPDILKWATKNKKKDQVVVGFALEDRNLRKNAEKKLKEKNLDMIIANAPSAIGMEKSKMEIKPANGKWIKLADAPKTKSAEMILEHIRRCFYS